MRKSFFMNYMQIIRNRVSGALEAYSSNGPVGFAEPIVLNAGFDARALETDEYESVDLAEFRRISGALLRARQNLNQASAYVCRLRPGESGFLTDLDALSVELDSIIQKRVNPTLRLED